MKNRLIILLFCFYTVNSSAQVARQLELKNSDAAAIEQDGNVLKKKYHELQNAPNLEKRGESHFYANEYLEAIQFPVGGIGTGCVQFDGEAVPKFWQIFNNMTHDFIPNSFMAVRVKRGDDVALRALQTKSVDGGLQGMASLKCKNDFPFLAYVFEDEDISVDMSMKVYNPFIPLNLKESEIPAVFYQITIRNTEDTAVEIDLLASQQNAVGFSKVPKIKEGESFAARYNVSLNRDLIQNNTSDLYGGNVNREVKSEGAKVLLMETMAQKPTDEHYGQMALMFVGNEKQLKRTNVVPSWEDMEQLVDRFGKTGRIKKSKHSSKGSDAGTTYSGAITSNVVLEPGEEKTFDFVMAWYFPNGKNGGHMDAWDGWGKGKWEGNGNNYANHWADINDLTSYIAQNHDRLYAESKDFNESFFETNLPYWMVERLSSQLAILKSRTMFHDKSGYVGLWEGAGAGDGSCAGNCNHVWHYAQAHARLFPDLARSIREQAYEHIKEDGQIPYRQPAGSHAFDGQCGDILATYREHLLADDSQWLKSQYPSVKLAIQFLINTWDSDRDGWLKGNMHTTYDCGMSGNASFLTSLYLATLKAGVEMAIVCGDTAQSERWKTLSEKSANVQNERLWNGEYYIQIPDTLNSASDYMNGCHSDQLLGQWWADQLGLGELYPTYRMESAFNAILKYNFKSTLEFHKQAPREFAKKNEPGMIVTTWPLNDRPAGAPGYSDEIWSTYEYTLAASLFKQGQSKDALAVMSAGVKRYDGKLKKGYIGDWGNFGFSGNPFGDDECGQFYSRSLCQWSVLLAAQGFDYNGPKGELSFSPKWKPENHNSYFTTTRGWGNFTQEENGELQINTLKIQYGLLNLNLLTLDNLLGKQPNHVEVLLNDKALTNIQVTNSNNLSKVTIKFQKMCINKNDILKIKIK